MPKVGFVSLGCPKNLVDSEVMMGILTRDGYELTPRADEAEVLVVNTCSFIEAAQKESVDAILEMAEYKKFGAAKKLIVAGCLVERYREQILEQVPEVDAVVGTGEVERILEAVQGDLRVLPAQPPTFLYHDFTPRIVTTPKHAAYIKIAEGCDHPCTFCIIPELRGKFRSRRFESVVREAENLAAAGTHAEVDSGSFAADVVYRGISRRNRGRLQRIVRFREGREAGLDGRVRVLGRGQRRKPRAGQKGGRGNNHGPAKPPDGHSEENLEGEFASEVSCGEAGNICGAGGRPFEGQSAGVGSAARRDGA